MVDCEVCMEKFPIDCFEFFPCAHKLCRFCYHNIKQLKCPYCRYDLEPPSEDENDTYDFPEPPPEVYRRRTRRQKRNRRRNRNNINNLGNLSTFESPENTSERFSNNSNVSNASNASNTSNSSNSGNASNVNNPSYNINNINSLFSNNFSLLSD